jgi:hypothetical protein
VKHHQTKASLFGQRGVSAECAEDRVPIRRDGHPRVEAFREREVVPRPAPAAIKRHKCRARVLLQPFLATRADAAHDGRAQQVIRVARVDGQVRLEERPPLNPNRDRDVLTHANALRREPGDAETLRYQDRDQAASSLRAAHVRESRGA